ncbi:STAS domain-containing protein [Prauserella flavalba]|uniref:STAS domain-containing protein n=1 Tax=Prauserella flavalba TaxID=1477506 RepID=UPI0036E0DAB9
MTLRIAVSEDPEGHTVVLAGELVLDTTGAPRAELAALLAGAAPGARVRLDLAGLTLLDSSELSVLIRAHKTAAEHGGACCSRTRPRTSGRPCASPVCSTCSTSPNRDPRHCRV